MSLSNINWNGKSNNAPPPPMPIPAPPGMGGISQRVCVHNINDPNSTIVVNPATFQPFCKVCQLGVGNNVQNVLITAPATATGGQMQVAVPTPQGFSYQINVNGAGFFPVPPPTKKIDPEQEKNDAFDRAMRGVG